MMEDFEMEIMIDRLAEMRSAKNEYPGDDVNAERASLVRWIADRQHIALDAIHEDSLSPGLLQIVFTLVPELREYAADSFKRLTGCLPL